MTDRIDYFALVAGILRLAFLGVVFWEYFHGNILNAIFWAVMWSKA